MWRTKIPIKRTYGIRCSLQRRKKGRAIVGFDLIWSNGKTMTSATKKQIKELAALGLDKMPICMAKTQYSFSDDATLLGAPTGFNITVREVKVNAGAGFIVALTGAIMTMPGLPKVPAANGMDITETGEIIGLS